MRERRLPLVAAEDDDGGGLEFLFVVLDSSRYEDEDVRSAEFFLTRLSVGERLLVRVLYLYSDIFHL